ncbi:A disintegrin and metalloproteinase with thrombospondin motifs 7 isoform X2 [Thalassophryne amazonica]|uniref:A disintegrin and metalloproteinase with thrombospondin motifs 7 isoform X2 n=1 Tax=Thalassophryne amazonica TaxID=390379 RepID=UPI001470C4BD|nr:A disintegrin and metalloproteinase with thrombospondin motifs 7 isoform X2 [Thalassophryne amazonica]
MSRPDRRLGALVPGFSSVRFFLVLLTALQTDSEPADSQYEVVHPIRVDAKGRFLSNILSYRASRVRRMASEESASERVFYRWWHGGHSLHFNLTLNPNLLAPGFLTERRHGGLAGANIQPARSSRCYFLGEVWNEAAVRGTAAISTCHGLTGLFKLSDEEFFIQPLEESSDETSAPQAHVVYKRHTSPHSWSHVVRPISGKQTVNGTCGVQNSYQSFEDTERRRERWEQRHRGRRRRIDRRSVSTEKWVETLVVADPKMVEYHGSRAVESYVLAVMNIVSGLFQDSSIGNAINIVVVRLVLLEQDEDELKITHHADNSLNSFCKWQKKLNTKGDEHPLHHDVAVLLTRKDICAAVNTPCETLGLSHVAGMCQPHRSCSISEDTGLPLAFTVAHELGHNFGIQHDGSGNDCEPVGKRPFVMSPQLLYGTFLPRWSHCSRQYITRFLDRGWGWCLDDAPVNDRLAVNSVLPGVVYTAAHQCQLQYGSGSLLCDDTDNVCSTLWCTVGTTCHSKLDGAVDGTSCGEDKWCVSGECVSVGHHFESVPGSWGSWTEWSSCSRSCGAGVQTSQRDCDNPRPKHRGRYCLGERRRYRICNTTPCALEHPTFRDIQCSHFNSVPYKEKFYKWAAVINKVNPCELHCRPLNEHFSEKMLDTVTDGTRCYEGSKSRDMCINGICKRVGCDYVIGSDAAEDRCGVCLGNGSTCTTVRRTFEKSEGLGYVDVGLIPEGSWDIRIEEVAEAGNFLALRSDNADKYFLNGGWTIQWNGDYKAAGAVFTYKRTGHLENLTSSGPTLEPLWIQLLFQETNPGVRYEYTISQNVSEENNIPVLSFFWKYGSWTPCSATCGTGVQRQIVHCVEKTTGIVEKHFCDPLTQADDRQISCKKEACPAVWWVGEWQKCSSSCGRLGLTKRTVMCVRAVSVDEERVLQPCECRHVQRPESVSSCNTHVLCPADWTSGEWSQCSMTCGSGVRRRMVSCTRNTGVDCDPQKKPPSVSSCHLRDCVQEEDHLTGGDWSGSGWTSKEVLNEINAIFEDKAPPKHGTVRTVNQKDLNNIIEADFSDQNNIENIDHSLNSIKVDDFYYDYNFINFHEDLSDDFETKESDLMNDTHLQKPSHNVSDNPSNPPVASKPTSFTGVKLQDATLDNVEDKENTASKEWNEMNFKNMDVFLSEDYLLPVLNTPSPSIHGTRSTQKVKERHGHLWRPEHNMSDVGFGQQDVEQSRDQTENYYEDFTEDPPPKHVTSAPNHQTTNYILPTTATGHEAEMLDGSRYSYTDKTTQGPRISTAQEPVNRPGVSPFAETIVLDQTYSHPPQLDEVVSEMSQTISQLSRSIPNGPHLNLGTNVNIKYDSEFPDGYLSLTSSPVSDKFNPPTSGDQQTSDSKTTTSRTDFLPPPNLEVATLPSPVDFHTAMDLLLPESDLDERAGTYSTSENLSEDQSVFDYNEIIIPVILSTSSEGDPTHLRPLSTAAPHQDNTVPAPRTRSPVVPEASTHPPGLRSASVPTPSSIRLPKAAYWVTGNWSTCSTTCGLGAIWRTLACSTGSDSDCDPTKRPVPAQRCYLRPCSTWKIGEWNKCSRNCDGGLKTRDVQCYDLRHQRPLRPFHCRVMSSRPPSQMPCNLEPCLDWYTSSWGQCSEVCGGGEQQRIVTCPEEIRCDLNLQPSSIQPCNLQPCAQWLSGSWGQCSASCGGGEQRRLIKCINMKVEPEEEVDEDQCDHEPQPEKLQKCNLHACESTTADKRVSTS